MPTDDKVLKEIGTFGRYRARVVQGKNGPMLDIREYIESDTYTGFTRKGVRMTRDQLAEMLDKSGEV